MVEWDLEWEGPTLMGPGEWKTRLASFTHDPPGERKKPCEQEGKVSSAPHSSLRDVQTHLIADNTALDGLLVSVGHSEEVRVSGNARSATVLGGGAGGELSGVL